MSEPKFKNLVELYTHSVSQFADRPLFGVKKGDQWQWSTYRDFGEQVDAARGGLAAIGVGATDRVAVIANNRPEWAVLAYATYGLGASYVPMYEAQLAKEWKYIIDDCGAKVVVAANEKIRDQLKGLKAECPTLAHIVVIDGTGDDASLSYADLLEKGRAAPTPLAAPEPSSIAGFIYTSGTTGNPKGVLLSHSNIASNVSAMHVHFPMEPDDRSLSFLPWAHSFGQTVELHGLISMGASMGIAESREKIVQNLAEVRPTLLFSVPAIFNKIYDGLNKRMAEEGGLKKTLFDAAILNAGEKKRLEADGKSSGWVDFKHNLLDKLVFSKVRDRFGGRLRYAFSGGAAISTQVAEFIDSLGILVYEGYGLTETSPIATANYPGARKIGSVGKPIQGVSVKIDRSETKDPKQGEIVVYGHCVMQGYHNLPEENAKVFTEDKGFRTGDMGYIDDNGFLYITGRIKEQYKLENGKYVVPSPLEDQLKLSAYVTNVMIYGDNKPHNVALIVPDMEMLKKWGAENGVAEAELLTSERTKKLFEEELEKYSGQFKQYEKVRKFAFIPEDFTTENGLLTPKMSLKRRVAVSRFESELSGLY